MTIVCMFVWDACKWIGNVNMISRYDDNKSSIIKHDSSVSLSLSKTSYSLQAIHILHIYVHTTISIH